MLGYSKRFGRGAHRRQGPARLPGTYLSIRFGNMLGRGVRYSPGFAVQIVGGGPVTVTDPSVPQYFMTIEEAYQLVIQAAAIGRRGEALVLDMGESRYTGWRRGQEFVRGGRAGRPACAPPHLALPLPPLAALEALAIDPWPLMPDAATAMQTMCRSMGPTVCRWDIPRPARRRTELGRSRPVVAQPASCRSSRAADGRSDGRAETPVRWPAAT